MATFWVDVQNAVNDFQRATVRAAHASHGFNEKATQEAYLQAEEAQAHLWHTISDFGSTCRAGR